MKGYKKYKDSGILRFGMIPENWIVSKLKFYSEVTTGNTPSMKFENYYSEDEGIPWVKPSDLNNLIPTINSKQFLTNEGLKEARIVRKGAILVGGIGDIGKLGIAGVEITTNQQIHAIEANIQKIDDSFLKYTIFNSKEELQKDSSSVVLAILTKTKLLELNILIPPLSEQIQIASFLDKKTALIDEIIAKKERLIETLQAKRQATINEVVTGKKVWNPKTNTWTEASKVKNSGIDWLGEIPEDWEVVKLKYLVSKVGSGVTPRGGGEVYSDEGVIFVRSQNVHFDGLRLEDIVRIDVETHESMSGSKVQRNDVLLNITGASIGRCCVVNVDDEINVNQHVSILRTNERIFPYFLNLVLQSSIGQLQVNLKSSGGNREGLTAEAIKTFIIPLPKKNEQLIIIDKLGELISHFETTIFRIKTQIQKLKEYRQSLISEAVTGKIDVSDWLVK